MTGALKPYPAYRDSGVPWLGEVPVHWEVRRMRNVADMRVSNVDKHAREGEEPVRLCNYVDVYKNDYIDDRIEFMKATSTVDELERFRLKKGDVLITKDSEAWDDIGVPALVTESASDVVSGYHLALLRPRVDTIQGSYLFHVLQSASMARQFHVLAKGVTRYGLSHADIKSIWLPLPPPSEQAAIARYLDHVSERVDFYIGAKERLIALLNEKKQAIIDRVATRGLDPNASMKRTGIDWMPEVPAHWEVRRLGQMGRLSKGSGGSKEDETSGGIPCVRYGDLYTTHSYFIERTRSFISEETSKNYTPIFFGDVLFASSGETIDEIGKSAVNLMRTAVCCGADVILFRLQNDAVARYMGYALDCHSSAAQKAAMGRGITVMHIYAGQLKRLPVPFPPLSEQAAIVEHLERSTTAIDAATGRTRCQINLFREYRERLINDVVTGKLDVREARLDTAPDVDALEKAGQAPLPRVEANATAIP